MLYLTRAWINGLIKSRAAGDLTRHRAHYDVIVIYLPETSNVAGNLVIVRVPCECPCAGDVTLTDVGLILLYKSTTKHNKVPVFVQGWIIMYIISMG